MSVDCILPVRDGWSMGPGNGQWLARAIDSILQDGTWEWGDGKPRFVPCDVRLILVDDNSKDGTLEHVMSQWPSVTAIPSRGDGISEALNTGLAASQSDLVLRMDSDDVSLPGRIPALLQAMKDNPHAAVCGTWAYQIDQDGSIVGLDQPRVSDGDITLAARKGWGMFVHGSVVMRRSMMDRTMVTNPERQWWYSPEPQFQHAEDYELWTRLLQAGIGMNIPDYLYARTIHPQRTSTVHKRLQRLSIDHISSIASARLSGQRPRMDN